MKALLLYEPPSDLVDGRFNQKEGVLSVPIDCIKLHHMRTLCVRRVPVNLQNLSREEGLFFKYLHYIFLRPDTVFLIVSNIKICGKVSLGRYQVVRNCHDNSQLLYLVLIGEEELFFRRFKHVSHTLLISAYS